MSVDLKVAPCEYKAAKYAVQHWHYSKRMTPSGQNVMFGVWENDKFIGAIVYGRGSNHLIGDPYGLTKFEVCELVRVALTVHQSEVSKIVASATKMLKQANPGLRLVVSYADTREGHHGGIYQAMNWVYVGRSAESREFFSEGRWKHQREATGGPFGRKRKITDLSDLPTRKIPGKHKYLYPLDKAMRRQIEPLAKPYPKRADVGEIESR